MFSVPCWLAFLHCQSSSAPSIASLFCTGSLTHPPMARRASLPPLLHLSLGLSVSICLLSFYALPKGFPTSLALQTSWGEYHFPALPAPLAFFPLSPPSLLFFPSPFFLAPQCDSHWFLVSNWQYGGVYLMMMISLCIWFVIYCRSACNAGGLIVLFSVRNLKY